MCLTWTFPNEQLPANYFSVSTSLQTFLYNRLSPIRLLLYDYFTRYSLFPDLIFCFYWVLHHIFTASSFPCFHNVPEFDKIHLKSWPELLILWAVHRNSNKNFPVLIWYLQTLSDSDLLSPYLLLRGLLQYIKSGAPVLPVSEVRNAVCAVHYSYIRNVKWSYL